MRVLFISLCILLSFSSCKSSKQTKSPTKKERKETSNASIKSTSKVSNIVSYANTFKGVKYEFGGTTKRGMDCSGLIYTAFKHENVILPRVSRDMAKRGQHVKLNKVQQGDLLFFKTNKRQAKINHVGLVVNVTNNHIKFIHSTTSKGVITSQLSESYWNKAFVEARRVL